MNPDPLASATLESLRKLFAYYKSLGDKAMAQVPDEMVFWTPSVDGNSIAILVKHLAGNMRSRFTDFLTTDGEKPSRNRDAEFETEDIEREELLAYWEIGWESLFTALNSLRPEDMGTTVYIRNEGHLVVDALHRQLGHYAYHVGQMVQLARMISGENWTSLSIPRGESEKFNQEKSSQEKGDRHFTEGLAKED
jgi:hypothetical protein